MCTIIRSSKGPVSETAHIKGQIPTTIRPKIIHLPQDSTSFLRLVDVTLVQGSYVASSFAKGLVELELDYETDKVPEKR